MLSIYSKLNVFPRGDALVFTERKRVSEKEKKAEKESKRESERETSVQTHVRVTHWLTVGFNKEIRDIVYLEHM